MKLVLLFAFLWTIVGDVLYAVTTNVSLLLASRIVSGFGAGNAITFSLLCCSHVMLLLLVTFCILYSLLAKPYTLTRGAGNQAVTQLYLQSITAPEDRTVKMGQLALSSVLSFAVGPGSSTHFTLCSRIVIVV